MTPSIGRIVHYTLTKDDAERITKRRADFAKHRHTEAYTDTGYVAHFGNDAHEGDTYPAVIVRVFDTSVNLKVMLDGSDELWALSHSEGEGPGFWAWPPRAAQ